MQVNFNVMRARNTYSITIYRETYTFLPKCNPVEAAAAELYFGRREAGAARGETLRERRLRAPLSTVSRKMKYGIRPRAESTIDSRLSLSCLLCFRLLPLSS